MTTWLKQSTAADAELGPILDDTDFKSAETGQTLAQADCQLIKNGGTAAQKNDATSATHLGGGHYKVPLNSTDTGTLGRLRLYVNKTGCLPAWRDFMVVPANVYDALIAGSDTLEADVTQWKGSTAPAMTGDAYARLGAPAGASVSADVAAVKSDSGAIKTKTDNLPADPADDSDIDAQLATIAGYLDTEVAAILAAVDTEVAAIKAKTDNLPASPAAVGDAMTLASGAITAAVVATGAIDADALAADAVDEILDEPVEGSLTLRQAVRLLLAVLVGKSSGGGTTTITFRDLADGKNRVSATVNSSGDRSAVTTDAT